MTEPLLDADLEVPITTISADVAALHGELVRYGLVVRTGGLVWSSSSPLRSPLSCCRRGRLFSAFSLLRPCC